MDNLPQELTNRIALQLERCPDQPQVPLLLQDCVGDSKLPPYATLSKRWKDAVEFITFHTLRVRSDQLDDFRRRLTGNRRSYLRRLIYTVVLPEYPKEVYNRVETAQEQQENSKAFTQAISDLFSILKSWEDEGLQSTLCLEFPYESAYSQTDLRIKYMTYSRPEKSVDIYEKRYAQSFLEISPMKGLETEIRSRNAHLEKARKEVIDTHLTIEDVCEVRKRQEEEGAEVSLEAFDSIDLPNLSNVTYLVIRGNSSRKLAPSVGTSLATHLPHLNRIDWHFGEVDDKNKVFQNRIEFSLALDKLQLPHCSAAELDFYQEVPSNHGESQHARMATGSLYDSLSRSLRLFSHHLTSLTLSGHFDSSLFWPSSNEPTTTSTPPTWPSLARLKVKFNMVAPSGAWYFTGEPDLDIADDSFWQFRERGDEETLNPFLTAFSKAVQNMPVIEHFMLECELGHEAGFWELAYYAPGLKAEWGDEGPEDQMVRRLYYTVGEVWKPDPVIADGLRNAGKGKRGELIERFLEKRDWNY